jgi:polysaccharide chain length determinant protein (PEP-CTERM system associated)
MNATSQAIEAYDDDSIAEKLADTSAAVRRRRLPMAIAFGVVLTAALLLAVLLPASYRSAGTILIEQQEIPEDFVRSAVTSFADQRVQMISQRVMTSTNLLEIIERHDLYDSARRARPREQLIERIRDDIQLDMISADVVDPRKGGVVKATIAFSVAFNNRSPDVAARVANDLVSLFLRENLETRRQLAEGSAQFLASEAERLRRRIEELAQTIAVFKRDNYDRLPELADSTLQQLGRLNEELRELGGRVRALDQQIVILDSQLVQLSPKAGFVTERGERLLAPADRLKALRAEYTAVVGRYSARHPDVRRLEREIDKLEQEIAAGPSAGSEVGAEPDNPAYVQISAQREIAVSERASLVARLAELRTLIADHERAQSAMPEIEREYSALLREAESEQTKYAEIRQKLMAAQLSQNLESEQKGERFTLIDPPVRPQEPISPDRKLIAILGLVLAVGAAVGILLALEAIDTRVHGGRQVTALLGEAPLVVLPWATEAPARRSLWKDRRMWLAAAVLGGAGAVLLAHVFWRPLDVLWALLLQRIGA